MHLFTPNAPALLTAVVPSIKFDHPYASKHDLDRELRLPDLETFEFGPLPELDSLDESTISAETPQLEPEDDIWEAAVQLGPVNKDVLFYTWEAFEKPSHAENYSSYITEYGAEAFDAALANDNSKIRAGRVIKGTVLLQSLWNLGLGRSSQLFQFDAKSKTFKSLIQDGRPSGISLRAIQSVITQFIHTGNTFLFLRSFSERTFTSVASIPAKVALATVVSNVLSSLEDNLGRHTTSITSLIQLQHRFAKPREILLFVARLVDAVKNAKNNEQLASILHHRLLELEEGDPCLRNLASEILVQVSRPSLELLSEWIGIRREECTPFIWERNSFVVTGEATADLKTIEYVYKSEMMPTFISVEDGTTIFETGNSLRFLKAQHPEHPLARMDLSVLHPPSMEWGFEWQDIETITMKAKAYQERLQQILLEFSTGASVTTEAMDTSSMIVSTTTSQVLPQDLEAYFEDSVRAFEALPTHSLHDASNGTRFLLEEMLQKSRDRDADKLDTFPPPHSLVADLSFHPLITAQARLINAATLRLFFRSHQLGLHLSVQRQYHMFGDGVFSSLLATSLFDPERESAERHKGKMRSGVHMGLQLGSRATWPPASSELRLALRGVLSESYYTSALYHSTIQKEQPSPTSSLLPGREQGDLPGQLNFAIRPLSEAEQEKVMDPDALPALDFLCLQYVPPPPLNLVITSTALEKYDTIFKFLLRLLRMIFVVSHLPRHYNDPESHHFRIEAYHFVTVLNGYVFQSGIAEHWNDFESFVANIESRLNEEDAAAEIGARVSEGIASLRDAHEKCLDSIMFSLLLRKRQRKIILLVDEIFDCILLFAKIQKSEATIEESTSDLYKSLKGKIRVFLSVCKGLTGKKGYGKGKGITEEDLMERFIVAMEMNPYFAGSS